MVQDTPVFGDKYARYYDALYKTKNYEGECTFLEEVFGRYASEKPRKVLDVGCGTGGYAIPLAKRGYTVKGIDRSTSMITLARKKAETENIDVDFEAMDLRQIKIDETFDVCTCMFAVIDYLLDDHEIENALRGIRSKLHQKSLFVFDFWNGNAVLTVRPSSRTKTIRQEGIEITRTANPRLDTARNRCEVTYRLSVRRGGKLIDEFTETHLVRYFFQDELRGLLNLASFDLQHVCPFPELDGEIEPRTWNLAAIAVAR